MSFSWVMDPDVLIWLLEYIKHSSDIIQMEVATHI